MSDEERKRNQDVVLRLLEEKLKQENINLKDIQRLVLIDKEGDIYSENFEDIFFILTKNNTTILLDASFHAENSDVYFLLMHGALYKHLFKKDYGGLILVCYEIKQETVNQAENQGIKVITERILKKD